ncbi:hypothetical protein SLEP1_g45470 [Rubroshorea leprosula]|uniref:Uncharacterized protein n=1 Tax=Rubroshorea leprosula TaxID=152421 RepID=A0AAV5LJX7_9ROSI|nr:hypothetical protein SLEP1_g45470 [Rubroshorea leprosula]
MVEGNPTGMSTGPAGPGSASPSPSPRMAGMGIPAGIFDGGQILPPVPVPHGECGSPRGSPFPTN